MYWIYLLRCQDGTLYTGITTDLDRRLRQHAGLAPGGAKYTRRHPPDRVLATWQAKDRRDASRFEWHCKRLSRQQKLALAEAPEKWAAFLPEVAHCEIRNAKCEISC